MLDKRFITLTLLAKNQSYTETANELFITQPAVSQQISSLEEELHLQLVDKTKRKIKLTSKGTLLANYASQIEVESNKVIDGLKQGDNSDHLKLGCTLSLSSTLLPKFINSLSKDSKIITTEINNTTNILQNIRDGKVDFGLIEGNFNKNEFDSIFLQNEKFICVANSSAAIQSNSIAELLDQTIYIREIGSGSREIFEHWLGTQNYQITDFAHIVEIASPTVIIQLLQTNPGISFIYESLVKDELKNGKIKRLDLKDFQISHPINLVFLKDSYFTKTYQNLANTILGQDNKSSQID